MGKYGFCWASNKYLSEMTGTKTRMVQYNLAKLKKEKYLVVEVEYNNDRKIWTPGTWAYREKYMQIYGEEIINCKSREEFNQRFTTYAMDCRGGMQCIAPYNAYIRQQRHKEAAPPGDPPSPDIPKNQEKPTTLPDGTIQLAKTFFTGVVPSENNKKMTQEVKQVMSGSFMLGSHKVRIHHEDWPWYYGFSPATILEAADRIHKRSKDGMKIHSYPRMLFAECAKVAKEKAKTR